MLGLAGLSTDLSLLGIWKQQKVFQFNGLWRGRDMSCGGGWGGEEGLLAHGRSSRAAAAARAETGVWEAAQARRTRREV